MHGNWQHIVEGPVEIQLRNYFGLSNIERDEDPLAWWEDKGKAVFLRGSRTALFLGGDDLK